MWVQDVFENLCQWKKMKARGPVSLRTFTFYKESVIIHYNVASDHSISSKI